MGQNVKDIIQEKNAEKQKEKYNQYVKRVTPTHNSFLNCCKAFLVGGIICTIAQVFRSVYSSMGFDEETTAMYSMITLVLISIILTGFQIYERIAKFGGAGTLVPITGFANSVASPAIEYQKEGQVFGIGCKIFTIAGPVILYGIFSSWILGLVYWIIK